jgi:hypothetical protein
MGTVLNPAATTPLQIVQTALVESGRIGLGQTPNQVDINDGLTRLQLMLQLWQGERMLIYCTQTLQLVSTGAQSYTIGPGGDFDTGQPVGSAPASSVRPPKLESAYLIQPNSNSGNPVSYPLQIMQSRDEFNAIALKQLVSFPQYVFLDTQWPLGIVRIYPVPQASIYSIALSARGQLPPSFAPDGSGNISLPYEYYEALVSNLAVRLRSYFRIPTFPGDDLLARAKGSRAVLRQMNFQVPKLTMPDDLLRGGVYNIFGDDSY